MTDCRLLVLPMIKRPGYGAVTTWSLGGPGPVVVVPTRPQPVPGRRRLEASGPG